MVSRRIPSPTLFHQFTHLYPPVQHGATAGAVETLVFVYGGQTDRRMWDPQFTAFAADHG